MAEFTVTNNNDGTSTFKIITEDELDELISPEYIPEIWDIDELETSPAQIYFTIDASRAYIFRRLLTLKGYQEKYLSDEDIAIALSAALNSLNYEPEFELLKTIRPIIKGVPQQFEIRVYEEPSYDVRAFTNECFGKRVGFYGKSQIYVLMTENKPVAISIFDTEREPDIPPHLWNPNSYYLYNVCTDENFRGQHLQETLIQTAFDHLKSKSRMPRDVYLFVYADNQPAIRLYERLGFNKIFTTTFQNKLTHLFKTII